MTLLKSKICCSNRQIKSTGFMKDMYLAYLSIAASQDPIWVDILGLWISWTLWKNKWFLNMIVLLKGRPQRKKNVFFRALPELPKTPPPMTPIRATWSSFFRSRNSRFESQFRTKNTISTIWYTVYMQPKKQLKVQYIGIFEEIDSFYWPKMHF